MDSDTMRRNEDYEVTLEAFGRGELDILVGTQMIAKGLDFPRVRHVIMYDFPKDAPTFIHRAGRTARRGAGGLLTCFVAHADMPLYRQIRQGEAQPGSAPELPRREQGSPTHPGAPEGAGAHGQTLPEATKRARAETHINQQRRQAQVPGQRRPQRLRQPVARREV